MRRVLTRCYTYLQLQAVVSFDELRTLYELRATPLRLSYSSSLSQARTKNHTCKAPYTPQSPTREASPGARCHGWSVAAASFFWCSTKGESIICHGFIVFCEAFLFSSPKGSGDDEHGAGRGEECLLMICYDFGSEFRNKGGGSWRKYSNNTRSAKMYSVEMVVKQQNQKMNVRYLSVDMIRTHNR